MREPVAESRNVIEFALPDGQNAKALGAQLTPHLFVTLPISGNLAAPEIQINLRQTPSSAVVTMPKTAVYKYAPGVSPI
jgi:hypothetical protein